MLTVACQRQDYSASRIAHAVEDCDAHLLNLNVTADSPSADIVTVELRVGHRNPTSVARSLQRYGFCVVNGMPDDDDTGQDTPVLQRFLEI